MPLQNRIVTILRVLGTPLRLLLTGLIYLYKLVVSPILPNSCIYTPSCSGYAVEALKKHGILLGLVLALTRVGRCTGSLFSGGDDPVPDKFSFGYIKSSYRKFWNNKKEED